MLTLAQALTALNDLKSTGTVTTAKLMELAEQVSLDPAPGYTQGSVTLLYSGQINGISSTDYIKAMIKRGEDIRVIDKTNVGQFLADEEFYKAWKAAGGTDAQLYHGSDGPWAKASRRFVADTVGEVRLLGFNAGDRSVFINTELKTALGPDSRITSIEGVSVAELRSMPYSDAVEALKKNTHLRLSRLKYRSIAMAFKNEYVPPLERETSEFLKKARKTLRTGFGKIGKWMTIGVIGVLTGCGEVDLKWSEEVQLDDGQIIVVKRTAKGEKQGELGGPGGWEAKEMSIALEKAAEGQAFPIWQTAYVPILLDYQASEKTWSMVATFYYCTGWYNLGRPKLPYVEYQSKDGGPWTVVPLEERLIGRKTNLLTGPRAGGEPAFLSLRDKKGRDDNAGDKYRKILAVWRTTC